MGEVQRAAFADVLDIYKLIKRYPVEVVPRSSSDILSNIDRFFVYKEKDRILGCVSWKILPEIGREEEHIVEVVSLCVNKRYHKRGIGRALANTVLEHVRQFNPTRVILLTFSPRFFKKLGFRKVSKRSLNNKIYLGCINCTKYTNPLTCPEVAMELKKAPTSPSGEAVA